MKKILSGLRGKTLFSLLLLGVLMTQSACHTTHKAWFNLNYVFKEGYDSLQRRQIIDSIKQQIGLVSSGIKASRAYNPAIYNRPRTQKPGVYNNLRQVAPTNPAGAPPASTGPNDTAAARYYANFTANYFSSYLSSQLGKRKFKVRNQKEHYCSCNDTLLWNLTADLIIGGAGKSAPTPAVPVDNGGVQGGAFEQLDNNSNVKKSIMQASALNQFGKISFPDPWAPVSDEVLAIIDTGIDTTRFDPKIYTTLLSGKEAGAINVMPDADSTNYRDHEDIRHGSAVAAIALKTYYEQCSGQKLLPKLLVLKALDDNGHGSTFSISCALSYAVRHKVTAINASLGYWGNRDSVMNHYLRLCANAMIPVIVSAGNDTLPHVGELCQAPTDNRTELGANPASQMMFYPACLSVEPDFYVITVTGMSDSTKPCHFQFYSPTYVNIGVVNKCADNTSKVATFKPDICCGFKVPFISDHYVLDGSSFATPVVSGRLLYEMKGKARDRSAMYWLNMLHPQTGPNGPYTTRGWYITTD